MLDKTLKVSFTILVPVLSLICIPLTLVATPVLFFFVGFLLPNEVEYIPNELAYLFCILTLFFWLYVVLAVVPKLLRKLSLFAVAPGIMLFVFLSISARDVVANTIASLVPVLIVLTLVHAIFEPVARSIRLRIHQHLPKYPLHLDSVAT